MFKPVIPEAEALHDYFAVLAAIIGADGGISPRERELFHSLMSELHPGHEAFPGLAGLLEAPPQLDQALARLRGSPSRLLLYTHLFMLAAASGGIQAQEREMLEALQVALQIDAALARELEAGVSAPPRTREPGDRSLAGAVPEPFRTAVQSVGGLEFPTAGIAAVVLQLGAFVAGSGATYLGVGGGWTKERTQVFLLRLVVAGAISLGSWLNGQIDWLASGRDRRVER